MTRKKWGRAGVFYGMLMDIDEKKKTDAKLLWRDTLADVMTQNLDSVYIILDKRNRDSLYVSPSIEKIFGIRKDIPHPLLAVQDLEQPESDDFSIEEVKNFRKSVADQGFLDHTSRRNEGKNVPENTLSCCAWQRRPSDL